MYKKKRSLEYLERNGFNIFPFYIPRNLSEFQRMVNSMKMVTVRFDAKDERVDNLPFYIVKKTDGKERLERIMAQAIATKCILLVSQGIQYDAIQKFNLVAKVNYEGTFIAEASAEKVPLRHMYQFPLLTMTGNIDDSIRDWNCSQYYGIDRRIIKDILVRLPIKDKWVECTYYPVPVGIKNENLIYWQVQNTRQKGAYSL